MAKKQDLAADIDGISLPDTTIRRGRGMGGIISQQQDTITPGTETELSDDEADELQRCEAIIDRGKRAFIEMGTALLRVRDLKLYRVDYPTFEAYCQARWGIERRQAYRLIDAAAVIENVSNWTQNPPANEAQARELGKLPPEEQGEAWAEVLQRSDGKSTAKAVEEVVRERRPPPTPPVAAPPAQPTPPDTDPPPTDEAQARIAQALAIIEEYQEHITRAQNYKPTSERGEAVSPLLRALERVVLLLKEGEARSATHG